VANVYGHKQWIINETGVITTDRVRIDHMEWVPNAANDDLEIVDNNSEEVWTVTNALTGGRAGVEKFEPTQPIDTLGFNVSTIGGGTLYVYLV
jgi:hypothetical protein